jgi:hypothetical protein
MLPQAEETYFTTQRLIVEWSTPTPRSCIISSKWGNSMGYAKYHRTHVRIIADSKWTPLGVTMGVLPLFALGNVRKDIPKGLGKDDVCQNPPECYLLSGLNTDACEA